MKEQEVYSELASIRNLMERSSKFISLSGFSGVLAGLYALVGSFMAYDILYPGGWAGGFVAPVIAGEPDLLMLIALGIVVLSLSLATGIWLTIRQALKRGESYWNPVSRRLLVNMSAPLLAGALLSVLMLWNVNYGMIVSVWLIFYGLSLFVAGEFSISDVRWLGVCEIVLGLIAACWPLLGLLFFALGFGLLHVLYGLIMHFKYKQ